MPGYRPHERAIVRQDGELYCNRSIFCANGPTGVLVGDRPVIRLIRYSTLFGTFRAWVTVNEKRVYLDQFESCRFTYRASMCEWQIHSEQAHCALTLTAGVPEETEGFVLKISSDCPVSLNWEFGGITRFDGGGWNLTPDKSPVIGEPELLPEWLQNNETEDTDDGSVRIYSSDGEVFIRSVPKGILAHRHLHMLRGISRIAEEPVMITFGLHRMPEPADAFESMLARSERLGKVFVSSTPDAWLDAEMAVLGAEIDGLWYPPCTVHNNQLWNRPFVGWLNRYGHSVAGWFDRVRDEMRYYTARMNREDKLHGGEPDHGHRECVAGPISRFYGQGRITSDQAFYNMQTQFFDQAIFAWRMTGDPEIADMLREALELHTRWQDECFDPDKDGLYESYINSWPTDSVWYSGGGSCEETCYAYRSHTAAYELCTAAGDSESADYHREVLRRIEHAFKNDLWLKDAGYPAMVREYYPPHRLHRSAWLYNSFLPPDVGLVDAFDAETCLDYSRWALQNVREPMGGRTVWFSNWVPELWSVRRNEPGENYQLAHGYFMAGFAEDGYAVLCGALRRFAFDRSNSPGHMQSESESASLLSRTIVCGLHGYRPDYPNQKVLLAPQYPFEWRQARLETTAFASEFRKSGCLIQYSFALQKPAAVTLRLPLGMSRVTAVEGAGSWREEPFFGGRILICELGECSEGKVEVQVEYTLPFIQPIDVECTPGNRYVFNKYKVIRVYDPQELLAEPGWNITPEGGAAFTLRNDMDGHHTLFLLCENGGTEFWLTLRLNISPTLDKLRQKELVGFKLRNPEYKAVSLLEAFNADVAQIFRKRYLTPRPEGVNLSIGSDGYSPWTFSYWGTQIPNIRFVCTLCQVESNAGVPYLMGSKNSNIAFTSRWDNWPDEVTVPVGRTADAIHCLVCGSTNPMQCDIANAVLLFRYEDGQTDELEIIPPFNFWTLCPYTCTPGDSLQQNSNDYNYETSAFCLPKDPPDMIELGTNCRAVSLSFRLRAGVRLESVTLKCLSHEVIIGLMAVTLATEHIEEESHEDVQ